MNERISIPIKDSHRLINAGSLILVSVSSGNRSTITPIAWHMPVSGTPKLVAIALAAKHFSLELIETTRCFCINLPDHTLLDRVLYCGSHSGRNVNKFVETELTAARCNTIDCLRVEDCSAHIECMVSDIIPAGDHKMVIGEVTAAYCLKEIWRDDGTLDPEKLSLIQHLGGTAFGTIITSVK